MAFIKVFALDEAGPALRRLYDAAIARAGRVWNIVSIMGQNPRTLEASMGVYLATMHAPSPLSRRQREMLAVVVSAINECHY